MNYLNFSIKLLLLLVGYIIASFLAKFVIMLPLANALQGDVVGLYFSLVIAISIAGLCLGTLCSRIIKDIPLFGALGLAILATTYKCFRPDLSPLPHAWFAATLAMTFVSIMVGAFAAKRRQ